MEDKPLPKTAILILNWKKVEATLRCIESIEKSEQVDFEIFLLDNESTDKSFKKLKQKLKIIGCTTNLFSSAQNLGFTGGINYLINKIDLNQYNYSFLLNNDAKINAQTLENLIEQGNALKCHIIGPKTHSSKNGPSRRWPLWLFGIKVPYKFDPESQSWPTCNVDGSGVLLSSKLVKLIISQRGKLMDSRYFLYGEDTELGLFAARLGYDSRVTSKATIYHQRNTYPTEKRRGLTYYYTTRNRIFLANRYLHPLLYPVFIIYYVISRLLISSLNLIKNKHEYARAIMHGLIDGFRNKIGKWKAHK